MKGIVGECRSWGLIFIPCLLWSCLPPWEDLCMMTSFVASQAVVYFLNNVRGMLFLSTLVLLLWTKNVIRRWYRSRVLTRQFFSKLLHLGLTSLVALLAVFLVWLPLHEAYACAASKLDKRSAHIAMEWRDSIFVIFGAVLATSAVAQTDLVLRPSKVDGSGVPWVLKKLARLINLFLRKVAVVFRSAWRCLLVLNAPLARVSRKLSTRRRVRSRARGGLRPRDEEEQEEEEEEEEDEEGSLLAALCRLRKPKPTGKRAATRGDNDVTQSKSSPSVIDSTSELLKRCVTPPVVARRARASPRLGRHDTVEEDSAEWHTTSTSTPDGSRRRPRSSNVIDSTSQLLRRCVTPHIVAARRASGRTRQPRDTDDAESTASTVSNDSRGRAVSSNSAFIDTTSELLRKCVIPDVEACRACDDPRQGREAAEVESMESTVTSSFSSSARQDDANRGTSSSNSLADSTSVILRRCATPQVIARRARGRPRHCTESIKLAISRSSFGSSNSAVDTTSELLKKCVAPEAEARRAVGHPRQTHQTADADSRDSCTTSSSSQANAHSGTGSSKSFLGSTSALLQRCVAPFVAAFRARRSKEPSGTHVATGDDANGIAGSSHSFLKSTSAMLRYCVTPPVVANRARLSGESTTTCTRAQSDASSRASSSGSFLESTSAMLQQCVTPPVMARRARPFSESPRTRTPTPIHRDAEGRASSSHSFLESASAMLQQRISSPVIARRAQQSTESTTTGVPSLSDADPSRASSSASSLESTSTLLQKSVTPPVIARRKRHPTKSCNPAGGDDADSKASSSQSLLDSTSALLRRCVTPTAEARRACGNPRLARPTADTESTASTTTAFSSAPTDAQNRSSSSSSLLESTSKLLQRCVAPLFASSRAWGEPRQTAKQHAAASPESTRPPSTPVDAPCGARASNSVIDSTSALLQRCVTRPVAAHRARGRPPTRRRRTVVVESTASSTSTVVRNCSRTSSSLVDSASEVSRRSVTQTSPMTRSKCRKWCLRASPLTRSKTNSLRK